MDVLGFQRKFKSRAATHNHFHNQLFVHYFQELSINHLVYKMLKGLPEPKVMSSNCFFCPTNNLKSKDSLFTPRNVKKSSRSFIIKKLVPAKA